MKNLQLAEDDQPQYKLRNHGASTLSNSELLSLIVGHVAFMVLNKTKNSLRELGKISIGELKKIPGIGESKAAALVAAIELGRRRQIEEPGRFEVMSSSRDIATFLQSKLQDLQNEVFCVIYLNQANKIKHFEVVSTGGITGTIADPRIILKRALEENAVSIILSHNHPSGSLKPSRQDEELTHKIKEAAKYFDIKVLDHIIVSDQGYYSFADEGIL